MLQSIISAFGKGQITPHVKVDGKSTSPGYNYPKWTKSVRDNYLPFKSHTDSFEGMSRIFSGARLACSYKDGEKDVHSLRLSRDICALRLLQVSSSFFPSQAPDKLLITSIHPSLRTCINDTLGLENTDISSKVVMILHVHALYNHSIKILSLLTAL